jgi:uncharacterized protein DUF262
MMQLGRTSATCREAFGGMKYFSLSRIKKAILHLQNFDSNWVVVPLVLAANGVNTEGLADLGDSSRKGSDHFLDQFFNGKLVGLPPFENCVNSMRPRFSDIYPNMRSQGKGDDFVYHQPTKLWSNVYSSRGYREMRMAGLISGERSAFKLQPTFSMEWKRRIGDQFRFEELLIWLFAFGGFPDRICNWKALNEEFERTYVYDQKLLPVYKKVFGLWTNYPWPNDILDSKLSDDLYQQALIPSRLADPGLISQESANNATASGGTGSRSEEVEGTDTESRDSVSAYPIDDVFIRQEQKTAFEVIRRINSGKLILDPDFQRDFIWSPERQSKLIESALMRIPLPVFYLAENKDGKAVIVDGLQRLTTFKRFLSNEFTLQGLASASLLNKTYDDLPPLLQSRVEDTNLILYVIDHKVPDRAKLDIFERVNSGVPLSRQQMRNCMYVGPATRWLKEQARSGAFLDATARVLDPLSMRDRECVNRFCAFSILGFERFRGDLDQFLADALDKMNQLREEDLKGLADSFQRSMRNNYHVFGRHAFRKHIGPNERKNPLNVALFDVFSVELAGLDEEFVKERREDFRASFYQLMLNPVFMEAITSSTNDPKKVCNRFSEARSSIARILNQNDRNA